MKLAMQSSTALSLQCLSNDSTKNSGVIFLRHNVELTGAARPYRAASSDRRERG